MATITINTVQSLANERGINSIIEKLGKGYAFNGQRFKNLSVLSEYIKNSTVNVVNTRDMRMKHIDKTGKQGEEAILVNRDKIVVLQQSFRAPIPTVNKDAGATEKFRHENGGSMGTVVRNQLAIVPNKNGRGFTLPDELSEVVLIRQRYTRALDKYCLPYSIQGNRVVSIHHVSKVEELIKETNDELQNALSNILKNLPEWKKESQRIGAYIEGKFPTESYFTTKSYKIIYDFLKLGETFAFEDDIRVNAFAPIRENLEKFISSVSEYLNGKAKKFRSNFLENMKESLTILKESEIIGGDKVAETLSNIEKIVSNVNPVAIREAKEKIDRGVVDPSAFSGKGRRPIEVTKGEIDDCEEYLQETLSQLKELQKELDGLI